MYVLPILTPQKHDDCLKLEKIQKKFTKSLTGYGDLSYSEKLIKANLKSLELHRIFAYVAKTKRARRTFGFIHNVEGLNTMKHFAQMA